MKYIELQYAFELEANNIDKALTEKISSSDILYWLNQGVYKFIKTRYGGNNFNRTSFEQNEKRTEDLITLLKKTRFTLIENPQEGYVQWETEEEFPKDLLFILNENVLIQGKDTDKPIATEIFECTQDNYMYRIMNKLTDFHFHNNYARPLRVRTNNGICLFTDENYKIITYELTYLRNPYPIDLANPFEEYTQLPVHTHNEIVKLAVQAYIESTANQRYQTISNEVNTME